MKSEKKRSKKSLAVVLTAIMVLSVCAAGIVPVSATEVSVIRSLPVSVGTEEEFDVTLTQDGFGMTGLVNETLPEGFGYVVGSYTGSGTVSWNPATRDLGMWFVEPDISVTYRVTASSYEQTAVFSGIFATFVYPDVIQGVVGGDPEVGVDGTPPYTDGHNPKKSETGVPVDTNIVVHVKDNFSVDPNSIGMKVNGVPISMVLGETLFFVSLDDYLINYDPPVDFGSGVIVTVIIDASDPVGHVMQDEYVFATEGEDTDPPVITSVASSSITTDSATITWDTDEISDSLVKYGIASGVYTMEKDDAADVTAHSIDLTGLSADTTYYYVVNSTDPSDNSAESAEYSFTTEVAPDEEPPEITNVASSSITMDSATITWDTDENSDSLVKYGTASGVYTEQKYNAADVTAHSIGLTGLSADMTYYYVVNSTDPSDNSAESAQYSFITEAEEKPDLIVTAISPNCGYLFANESNNISATIKNNGTAIAGAFDVRFAVEGYSEEVRIAGLTAGASEEVTVTDTTIRNAGASVTITVIADCDGEVSESNEENNETVQAETVVNNGYKGKRYTGGEDINTLQTHTLNGSVLYSTGDSYYLSGYSTAWTTYTANWTAGDLPVPGDATIEKARLYVTYTWDKVQGMPDNVSLTFNDNLKTRDAFYTDRKGYGSSDYPYGMLAYDVTGDFNIGSINTAVLENLNPVAGNPSIRGMLLVVIYADDSEPLRKIIVNEGFDLLYGGSGKCTTPEEATAYAPFAGAIEDIANKSARLITVAPGADPNEGELIFNGHVWNDVWNFAGTGSPTPQIGIDDRDVTTYLQSTENEAGFRSSADYMEASNAILVVEYAAEDTAAPIVTNPDADPYIIPEDTDNEPLWGELSNLSVVVTDDSAIVSVTINLSSIGGSAVQAMTPTGDNVWYYETNASIDSAIFEGANGGYVAHPLQVNATDEHGYSNMSVSIELMVMKNGDVSMDGVADPWDCTYLARSIAGIPGYQIVEEVADVSGDDTVDPWDCTYLARYIAGIPGYQKLK